jgi:hypothetical protein
MEPNEARLCIGELLHEVKGKSGTLTNAYCDEVRLKIGTSVAMVDREHRESLVESLTVANTILDRIQARNRNTEAFTHKSKTGEVTAFVQDLNEDPIWMQNVEALEHSLAHYGVETKRLSEGRVRVSASPVRFDFPIGGTPKDVLARKLPSTSNINVNGKNALVIMHALGSRLKKYAFSDTLRITSDDKVKREISIKKQELMDLLAALFDFGPDGWNIRVDILESYGIQEA